MTLKKTAVIGSICLTLTALYPQEVWADRFRNSDFLNLPEIQQKGYLDGALNTLWQVAAFKSKEIGQCVYDWYHSEDRPERNSLILASMEKYLDHTPASILVALTERTCGRYVRPEKNR